MSDKMKKQFAVWMDTHHATIAGRDEDHGSFVILGHVNSEDPNRNTDESAANHREITMTQKFFKAIASKILNPDEIHLTGTGQIQEEFMKYLAETPQFKNAVLSDSTSNKMGDAQFIEIVAEQF